MDGIKLVRVDFRLIHGQVITKWSHTITTKKIIIVNNPLAEDDFMADIYKMAAPTGVEVEVITKMRFIESAKSEQYKQGNILLLFKNIEDVHEVVQQGVRLSQVQIGGLGSGNGKTSVVKGISVNREDIKKLEDIQQTGAVVTFQVTPEEPKLTLEKAKRKVEG